MTHHDERNVIRSPYSDVVLRLDAFLDAYERTLQTNWSWIPKDVALRWMRITVGPIFDKDDER